MGLVIRAGEKSLTGFTELIPEAKVIVNKINLEFDYIRIE